MHPGHWRTLIYRASNLTSPAYGKTLREARRSGDVETSLSRLCKSPVSLAVEGVEALEASSPGKHMYCVLAWDPACPGARE